ncbi:ABC transporter ATP-binding protein [Rhodococcus opacus]|uniref:ABC transporter ATP-binding protein n=1 Tax=Rhodococcus opacus TaxID=37919 RepID=A0A076EKH1_RHOOP|nr:MULTISPECIES: ABC transporter ATP-binding protein [Rhodococcus]NDV07168.1 ABC transporter ATP-binding protein [Rhodococcus sp. IEGM 248]NHU47249.1 ABC transporter ATP-binding protein [Rhodococcus sp. A14]AII03909.1 spermidine/putrescine ABC transporter ATP-binding protein [Rhodococcus opacus]MBA8963114.1 ABC-2 type transport system ATP-binding protein [Rhodococcus opacus]MBP2206604.1 ABC-2 type transport system ATP-binding protein [Rhodococcus opacus]
MTSRTPGSAQPAVRLEGVVKTFDGVRAVDGLDLTVEPAQVVALLGPNGAGKTTTVEMCEGFVRPDSGTVRVLGLDPVADAGAVRARIGVMLQGGGAYPGSRAGEMLDLVAAYSADPLDPDWLLRSLGLEDSRRTPYRRLSGGQQQRLSLACALVGRPELVFLDEPTAGLDAQARLLVWELIDALRRDGVSVLLTTHLMDEAEELADRLVIIDHGSIVAAGTPAEVTSRGAEGQLRLSAPAGLDTEPLARALPDGFRVAESGPGTYLVEGPIDPKVVASVASWCADLDALISDIRVDQRSLEDVFLELTGRELRG